MFLNESFVNKCLSLGIPERSIMIVLDRSRGVSLRAIAEDEGISPERVRQIEAHTFRKLLKARVVSRDLLV